MITFPSPTPMERRFLKPLPLGKKRAELHCLKLCLELDILLGGIFHYVVTKMNQIATVFSC